MIRTLRKDEEILDGMLADDKLFNFVMDDPESVLRISANLFFTILLNRVKTELAQRSYTIEHDDRHPMVVFDGGDVASFLQSKKIRSYLVELLTSFVRINSFTIPIRVRKGIWRKIRFSDFDIDSLIKYSQLVDHTQTFQTYKRIADICLFSLGVFPDYIDIQSHKLSQGYLRPDAMKTGSRAGLANHGRYFYKAAAQHEAAQINGLADVLNDMSEKFMLAAKPLAFMAGRYLGLIKEKLFLR